MILNYGMKMEVVKLYFVLDFELLWSYLETTCNNVIIRCIPIVKQKTMLTTVWSHMCTLIVYFLYFNQRWKYIIIMNWITIHSHLLLPNCTKKSTNTLVQKNSFTQHSSIFLCVSLIKNSWNPFVLTSHVFLKRRKVF